MVGLGIAISLLTNVEAGPRVLPEMNTHLRYATKCASEGWYSAMEASVDVISPNYLRIFIPINRDSQRTGAVMSAIAIWENALNKQVRIERVASASNADITIRFVDEISDKDGGAGGFAEWKRSVTQVGGEYVGKTTAQIKLAFTSGTRTFSDDALLQSALHEFGHVLGLDDSHSHHDVMGPLDLRSPVTSPQLGEISALKRLRTLGNAILAGVVAERR